MTAAEKKQVIKRLVKPLWKTKRFWMNAIVGIFAMIDYSTGIVRELLPGKEGAVVLLVVGFLNVFFQTRNNRRVRRAVDDGDIVMRDDRQ